MHADQPDTRLRRREFRRILLIKPSAAGDVIHALPVLVKLRQRYPAAQIDWLITPGNAELVRHHPALSNVVLFDRKHHGRAGRALAPTLALARFLHQLGQARYDLAIDLQGLLRSALFSAFTFAGVRIGFEQAREGARVFYSHRIRVPTLDRHAADRNLDLIPMLGLDPGPPDFTIHVPPEVHGSAEQKLHDAGVHQPYAVVTPGTSWETKHWTTAGFASVADYLHRVGIRVVLTGSPSEYAACAAVAKLAPRASNLCGKTSLGELAAIISRATIAVTNDSGPMHIAAAFGRPLVSVIGPTNAVRTGPHGRPGSVVVAGVPCAPCYLRKLSECPHEHRCMENVSANVVRERVRAELRHAQLSRGAESSPGGDAPGGRAGNLPDTALLSVQPPI